MLQSTGNLWGVKLHLLTASVSSFYSCCWWQSAVHYSESLMFMAATHHVISLQGRQF
jgi:hypothetical protein